MTGSSSASPARRSVCLVHEEDGKLTLHPDGVNFLTAPDLADKPLAIATVAGMYRTGKSFFLNQIARCDKEETQFPADFKVGSTTESCTRGIWVRVVESASWTSAEFPEARLLLFDTEGLASLDNDEAYDAKIFSLAILLSSLFLYNSMGIIDDSAVDRLILVTELINNHFDSADATKFQFPPFVWLLRDFTLELRNESGQISARQYMERAFDCRRGTSSRIQEYNRVRSSFKQLFTDRDCCTLVRPANDEAHLRELSDFPVSALREEFQDQLKEIKQKILAKVDVKTLYGEPVTGQALCNLAESYLETLNNGVLPDVKKAYEYLVESSTADALAKCREMFSTYCKVDTTPLQCLEAFTDTVATSRQACLAQFDAAGFLSTQQHRSARSELLRQMDSIEKTSFQSLETLTEQKCLELIRQKLDRRFNNSNIHADAHSEDSAKTIMGYFAEIINEVLKKGEGLKAVRAQCLVLMIQTEIFDIIKTNWTRAQVSNAELSQQIVRSEANEEKLQQTVTSLEASLKSLETDFKTLQSNLTGEIQLRHTTELDLENQQLMCEELKGERNTLVRKIEDIEPRYKGIVEECERLIALNAKQETKILELNSAAQAKVSELEKDLEKSELGVAKLQDIILQFRRKLGKEFLKKTAAKQKLVRSTSSSVIAKLQLAVAEQTNLHHLAKIQRLREERNELHQRLQDFFLRVSTLPEFYQSQVFCTQAGLVENW